MTKKHCLFLLLIFFLSVSYAKPPRSFVSAKKIVYKIFADHPRTLYCNCKYGEHHKIDLTTCHMSSASHIKRAQVTEIDHLVPAETLGHSLTCWQYQICEFNGNHYKGRKCCEKLDSKFKEIESELYNLWPVVGLVNIVRSNYSYGLIDSDDKFYGCDFKVNKITKEVEPSNRAKGIVARATLFMADKYHIPLGKEKEQLYLSWSKEYPPSKWEKTWASKIAIIEGYQNKFISVE